MTRLPLLYLNALLLLLPFGHHPKAKAAPPAAAPSLAAQVMPGAGLAVAWSNLASPTAKDWIGLFVPGTAGTAYLDWVYTNGQGAGVVTLKIAALRAAGLYELRIYRNDGYTLAGMGSLVQVGTPAPVPPPPPPPAGFGPRDPVGPDVAPAAGDPLLTLPRVTVAGFTAAAIQAACSQARQKSVSVVFLPAGSYAMETTVAVPGGITLLGAGSPTLVRAPHSDTHLFEANGDQVRFTRLKLQGWSTVWTDANSGGLYNDSLGIKAYGKQSIRVDHCELLGFSYALLFDEAATAQIDHCRIHDNPVAGLGYGVALNSGAYALVTDNEMGDCRHCLASNDSRPGYRPCHWEFLNNSLADPLPNVNQNGTLDTHPEFKGTLRVENNRFATNPAREAIAFAAGSGLIRHNQFTGIANPIRVYSATSTTGVTGVPHDLDFEDNTFSGAVKAVDVQTTAAVNITVDGVVVPATLNHNAPPPPPPIQLQPMGADGILRWTGPGSPRRQQAPSARQKEKGKRQNGRRHQR